MFAIFLLAALAEPAPDIEVSPRIRTLVLKPDGGPDDDTLMRAVEGLVAVGVGHVAALDVLSSKDVAQMLELEATRSQMGCTANESCLAEIAGAIGAELVVFGDISHLGTLSVITLSLFDAAAGRSLGRVSVSVADTAQLVTVLPPALVELFAHAGTDRGFDPAPMNPAPSAMPMAEAAPAVLPWVVARIGGVVAVAGVLGVAFGGSQWLAFSAAADEASTVTTQEEFLAASQLMDKAEQDYQSGGQLAVGLGAGAIIVGALVAAGGAAAAMWAGDAP